MRLFSEEVSIENLIGHFTVFTCLVLLEIVLVGSLGIVGFLELLILSYNNNNNKLFNISRMYKIFECSVVMLNIYNS